MRSIRSILELVFVWCIGIIVLAMFSCLVVGCYIFDAVRWSL